MPELVCITETVDAQSELALPEHMNRSFPLRVVKGLLIPGSPLIITPGLRRGGTVQEEALTLSAEKAERLGEFVSRVVVKQEPTRRNCASFAAFMAGGLTLEDLNPDTTNITVSYLDEVDPERLKGGESYLAFLADQKTPVHGAIGTDEPSEHLGVWGEDSLLAIGGNTDMMETYQAAHLLRVSGTFTATRRA